jgi:hypothetical protein
MDQWDDELNSLFSSYKAAVPVPEASANFMPELWRKIEGRRNIMLRVRKLTQVFVAAAAGLCLLFAMVQVIPSRAEIAGTYVDVLSDDLPMENLAALGIRVDPAEVNK